MVRRAAAERERLFRLSQDSIQRRPSQTPPINHAHLFVMLTRVRGLANLGISPGINWRFLEAINVSDFQTQRRAEEERLRAMATTFRNELEHDNLDNLFHTVCM